MNKFYTAIYCGSGNCFNLVAVFQPEVSTKSIEALKSQLNSASWAVAELQVDTATPPTKITMVVK